VKAFILTVCFWLAFIGIVLAGGWRELNTTIERSGYDDTLHFAFGAITTSLLFYYLPEDWGAMRYIVAVLAPIAIGTAKECTDVNFDGADIAGYAIGSFCALQVQIFF
jgi:hypothetical protein